MDTTNARRPRRAFARTVVAAALTASLGVVTTASPVAAASFVVDSTADTSDANPGNGTCDDGTGACTLRAAVEEANALAGADDISVPAGTYNVGATIRLEDAITITGSGNPTIIGSDTVAIFDAFDNLTSVAMSGLTLSAPGLNAHCVNLWEPSFSVSVSDLTLDGCGTAGFRILGRDIGSSVTATIDGLTGSGSAQTLLSYGADNGSLTLSNSTLVAGPSQLDIRASNGTVTIANTTLTAGGGGIRGTANTVVNLDTVTVNGSGALPSIQGVSGGSFVSNVTATDVTIDSAFAQSWVAGDMELRRVSVSNLLGSAAFSVRLEGGSVLVDSSTFTTSPAGLAVSTLTTAEVQVQNSTFSGNTGVGISALNSNIDLGIENSTFSGNDIGITIAGEVSIKHSIFDGNASGSCQSVGGTITSGGHNVDTGGSCGFASTGDTSDDPLLGPLAANGGATLTHLPGPGSSAIDIGGTCTVTVDQRGDARPLGASCDAGSVEAAPAPTVPSAPGTPTGVAAEEAVQLSWTAPSTDGGSAITGYRIESTVDDTNWIVEVADTGSTATTETIGGLEGDVAHRFRVSAINGVGVSPPSAPSAEITPLAPPPPDIDPVEPARFVDTRPGADTVDGAESGRGILTDGEVAEFQITGRGAIPDGVGAVAVNVTSVDNVEPGFITLYPCTPEVPNASNVNYLGGQVVANSGIVKLSPTGSVCVFALTTTHVIIDITGFLPETSNLTPLDPTRFVDTRPGLETFDGVHAGEGIIGDGEVVEFQITGRGLIPADASAAVVNATVIGNTNPGFVTLYPCTDDPPNASNVNYLGDQVVANSGIVKLSPTGSICVFALSSTHFILDVNGFLPAGSDVIPVDPTRYVDTRADGETFDAVHVAAGIIGDNMVVEFEVGGRGDVPVDASAVLVNATVVGNTDPGFVTLYPCTDDPPNASNVNYLGNQIVANSAIVKLSGTGTLCAFVLSETHLIIDVNGYIK